MVYSRHMRHPVVFAAGALALLLCSACAPDKPAMHPGMESLEMRLQSIVDGKSDAADMTVVYDDVHGLWGGVKMTVHGNGKVEQEVHAPVEAMPEAHDITPEEVRVLAKLLLDLEAWEQRTPERTPNADEARTTLTIRVGAMESVIWEWHNEQVADKRAYAVLEKMREFAW
jgi:hypothetical protein